MKIAEYNNDFYLYEEKTLKRDINRTKRICKRFLNDVFKVGILEWISNNRDKCFDYFLSKPAVEIYMSYGILVFVYTDSVGIMIEDEQNNLVFLNTKDLENLSGIDSYEIYKLIMTVGHIVHPNRVIDFDLWHEEEEENIGTNEITL